MTEAKAAEDRIHHLAHHDTLIQPPNRVLLHGRLTQAMAAARRERGQLAMLFIDRDRFKNINDRLGHPVGDDLLVEMGQRLSALVRDSDIVARPGDGEVVLLLTGTDPDTARAGAAVAAKVLAERGQPDTVRGHERHATPSIGIALFPADGEAAATQLEFLRHLGCDTVQGCFIARPLSVLDCTAFLGQQQAAKPSPGADCAAPAGAVVTA